MTGLIISHVAGSNPPRFEVYWQATQTRPPAEVRSPSYGVCQSAYEHAFNKAMQFYFTEDFDSGIVELIAHCNPKFAGVIVRVEKCPRSRVSFPFVRTSGGRVVPLCACHYFAMNGPPPTPESLHH
jgi:hypothetical protein